MVYTTCTNVHYNMLMTKRKPVFRPDRVKEIMEERGWKPGQLAVQSDVAYDTIYKLLNTDRQRPSAEIVTRLANALGCSVEYLMDMTDNSAPVTLSISDALREVVEIAKTLPEARQRDLLLMAQAYKAAGEPSTEDMEVLFREIEKIAGTESAEQIVDLLRPLPSVSSRFGSRVVDQ